jgi:hypothetical protein
LPRGTAGALPRSHDRRIAKIACIGARQDRCIFREDVAFSTKIRASSRKMRGS